jgi:hypothetical protein
MKTKFNEYSSDEEKKKFLEEDRKEMTEKIQDWKKNPDKYITPEYITPDGSKIAVIHANDYVVTGVCVESPIKVQIGFLNTFFWRELTKI